MPGVDANNAVDADPDRYAIDEWEPNERRPLTLNGPDRTEHRPTYETPGLGGGTYETPGLGGGSYSGHLAPRPSRPSPRRSRRQWVD